MNKDDLAYSLRLQSKRTDIPTDVVRSLSEAYQALQYVTEAVAEMQAMLVDQRTEIKRLRHMEEVDQLLIKDLLGVTEELRKERDEARREACEYATCTHPTVGNSPRALALDKGWDCYKDEDPRWKSDPRIISLEELERSP